MRWSLTLLVLAGCAPDTELRHRHDAVTTIEGTAGGKLGDTLAACPAGGFIAADPVHGQVWMSSGVTSTLPSTATRLPVACRSEPMIASLGLVSTALSTFAILPGGQLNLRLDAGVDAFALPPPGRTLAAVSSSTGIVWTWPTTTGAPVALTVAGQGARSIAWNNFGGLFLGNPIAGHVRPFVLQPDGGAQWLGFDIGDPAAGLGFGEVVVAGNVTRHFNDELVVSAPTRGAVYLFSGGVLLDTFQEGPSFGSAVVIDPRPLPGPPSDGGDVHAWYVSEPATDRVWRVIGNERSALPTPPEMVGTRFGQSLAMDGLGHLAVGAPEFGDGGAAFVDVFDTTLPSGETAACAVGQGCLLEGCLDGRCVGGVFCESTGTSRCGSGFSCVMNECVSRGEADAGVPDAGAPDAGVPDAGVPDSGAPDAGAPDSGAPDSGAPDSGAPDSGQVRELRFSTHGCDAAPGMAFGVAALLLRRARPHGGRTNN